VDPIRQEGPELLEAYLVCRGCREERIVLGGVAIVPADLTAHLRAHGNVYRRTPIADPRMVRFVLGQAWEGGDAVPFDEVVRRYGDLAPPGEPGGVSAGPAPEDAALLRLLAAHAPERGRGLDVGTGVGRGTFLLAARLGLALGLDRSVARVRRARNLATTQHPFTVPASAPGARETPLDLARLERQGVAFAAGDAEALAVADATMDVVVLRAGDGVGAWSDPLRALEEARRVATAGGLLVLEEGLDGARLGSRAAVLTTEPPFVAWRAA
jgi:SAM-dependent methyltransferase